MVVLRGRHGPPQSLAVLEVAHQDAQAVQVGVLRGDDLEDGLREKQLGDTSSLPSELNQAVSIKSQGRRSQLTRNAAC